MSKIELSILGDICPDWGFRRSFDKKDTKLIFGDVLPELLNADLAIANFECPATDEKTPIVKCGPNLKARPGDLGVLKEMGISAMALANNHILDYGEKAVLDTLAIAKVQNIFAYGAGNNREEAARPCFIHVKDKVVGLMAFAEEEFNCATDTTPGANLFDPYTSLKQVEDAKKQCDYLIVQYHGGIEHYRYPSPLLQKKCRAMVEAGANLVLCQHSHCIGTYENYLGSTVLYGQGNAIFGRREGNEAWNTGLLVQVEFSDNEETVSFKVFEAGEEGISFASDEKNSHRLKQMEEESSHLNDSEFIKQEWNRFCERQCSAYLPAMCCWNRISNKINRIFKNFLVNLLVSKNQKRVAMNLIRCDAHREVLQTILENDVLGSDND